MLATVLRYLGHAEPNNPSAGGAFVHVSETDHWWHVKLADGRCVSERQRMLLRSEREGTPYTSVNWAAHLPKEPLLT